jgi:hypothetical protein
MSSSEMSFGGWACRTGLLGVGGGMADDVEGDRFVEEEGLSTG